WLHWGELAPRKSAADCSQGAPCSSARMRATPSFGMPRSTVRSLLASSRDRRRRCVAIARSFSTEVDPEMDRPSVRRLGPRLRDSSTLRCSVVGSRHGRMRASLWRRHLKRHEDQSSRGWTGRLVSRTGRAYPGGADCEIVFPPSTVCTYLTGQFITVAGGMNMARINLPSATVFSQLRSLAEHVPPLAVAHGPSCCRLARRDGL